MGSLAGGSSRRTKGSQKSLLIINIVPFGTTGQILYNMKSQFQKKVKTHVVTVFFRGTKKIDKKLSDFNICITVSDTFPMSIF